jgi:tetratricopeptide (TPR) repeat protein
MELPLFIGRETELAQLKSLLIEGAHGRGSILFIQGEAGMGKTLLLDMLQTAAHLSAELDNVRFTYGYCHEETGTNSAYQPLIEILDALTKADQRGRDIAKLILTILKETGPDWLQIIPGVGAAVSAGIKTVTIAGQWLAAAGDAQHDTASLASQYVNTILKIADRFNPLTIVIEDAHWIDDASCQLLLRLARHVRESPLIVLITYRPSFLPESHPLKHIQSEMFVHNLAEVISLDSLTEDQIREYVAARFRGQVDPHLAAWLSHLCNGNPFFVSQYLSLLEQSHVIRPKDNSYVLDGEIRFADGEWELSDNIPVPQKVETVLEQRIQRLMETDQKMLQQAAIQGEQFLSTILSEVLEVKELELLPRLRKIVEEHKLIRYGQAADEQWAQDESEVYVFEHSLMHRVFYQKLSPRERVLYHRQVAEVLERALKSAVNPPRKLVLEIAHHHDLGNNVEPAARYYWLAAQSSYADGALTEAVQLCQKSLEKVRRLQEESTENYRLRAEVVHLLLVSSEMTWRGKPDEQRTTSLEELANEAEAAAGRTNDLALISQMRFVRGQIIHATRGVREALKIMREALELAQRADDPMTQFIIMSRLGNTSAEQGLEDALNMLVQAHELYKTRLADSPPPGVKPAVIARSYHMLQSNIGIGRFDQGEYGEAVEWLLNSVAGLEGLKMPDYLPGPYNYLAQLYTAAGRFEDAEATLRKAIALFKNTKEPNAWNGYNLALLGKLYMEWNRVEEAGQPLILGWEQTKATWYVPTVPLVRNYYAELLMNENYSGRNRQEAENLLFETVRETEQTGSYRSLIAALSLMSRLSLLQNRIDVALEYSVRAMEYLKKMGMTMPALRTEEVLFNHYQVLTAAGKGEEARGSLEQAYKIIRRKASTFKNNDEERSYLERVAVNRQIIEAMNVP